MNIQREKLINDKYYTSIRYLTHSFKGEQRRKLILDIGEYNIYLAAQCIMSCEQDIYLENQLATRAKIDSQSKDVQTMVYGFLALIELNRYDVISDIVSKIDKFIKIHRSMVTQIINEVEPGDIIKFVDIIVDTKIKGLINAAITAVFNREVIFTSEQHKEIKSIYCKLKSIFNEKHISVLKFHMAFDLPKKNLPSDLNKIAKRHIMKGKLKIIENIYQKYDINFSFTSYELCKIYLSNNKQKGVLAFADKFFLIEEEDKRSELLKIAIKRGDYYVAFCLSLVNNVKKREKFAYRFDNYSKVLKKVNIFLNKNYPNINQKIINTIISDELKLINSKIYGNVVQCEVTKVLPKTIFVRLRDKTATGSIWISDYSESNIEDATKVVKIGEKLEARIVGKYKNNLQLSVKDLVENNNVIIEEDK